MLVVKVEGKTSKCINEMAAAKKSIDDAQELAAKDADKLVSKLKVEHNLKQGRECVKFG